MAKDGHRFKKGQSGNPSGRPKIYTEVSALARAESIPAMTRIIEMSQDPTIDQRVRFKANEYIVNRACGKPKQETQITATDGVPFIVQIIEKNGK